MPFSTFYMPKKKPVLCAFCAKLHRPICAMLSKIRLLPPLRGAFRYQDLQFTGGQRCFVINAKKHCETADAISPKACVAKPLKQLISKTYCSMFARE